MTSDFNNKAIESFKQYIEPHIDYTVAYRSLVIAGAGLLAVYVSLRIVCWIVDFAAGNPVGHTWLVTFSRDSNLYDRLWHEQNDPRIEAEKLDKAAEKQEYYDAWKKWEGRSKSRFEVDQQNKVDAQAGMGSLGGSRKAERSFERFKARHSSDD